MQDLTVLCVCTHNRTRSVMAAALLDEHLATLGAKARVDSAGVAGDGEPATAEAVALLQSRGHDVSGHRSRRATPTVVAAADLVVTAEHQHVIQLAGRSPDAFGKIFTLPELIARSDAVADASGDLDTWLGRVNAGRPAAIEYLDAQVAEVDDPTGRSRRDWDHAYAEIDRLTRVLAERIAS